MTYTNRKPEEINFRTLLAGPDRANEQTKWKLYSGLFVLLKQKPWV